MFVSCPIVHGEQVADLSGGNYYCIDRRAHLRWRMGLVRGPLRSHIGLVLRPAGGQALKLGLTEVEVE